MTSIIRLLISTFHPATGSVRAGEVVEVPSELAEHWTNNQIAEDASGQEVTRHTAVESPTGQDGPNEFGQWPDPRPLGEPNPTPVPAGRFSSMIGRQEAGMAPAAPPPTTTDGQSTVAEPTSGPMTPELVPNADVPVTPQGEPTVAEPTSGPMTGRLPTTPTPEPAPAPTTAPAPEPPPQTPAPQPVPEPSPSTTPEAAAEVPFTAEGTLHAEPTPVEPVDPEATQPA